MARPKNSDNVVVDKNLELEDQLENFVNRVEFKTITLLNPVSINMHSAPQRKFVLVSADGRFDDKLENSCKKIAKIGDLVYIITVQGKEFIISVNNVSHMT